MCNSQDVKWFSAIGQLSKISPIDLVPRPTFVYRLVSENIMIMKYDLCCFSALGLRMIYLASNKDGGNGHN